MRIPGVKTAKKISRWVKARILGGAMILGYHRVAKVDHDEYEVCITPEHFAEHMEILSRYAHPIQLSRLVKHLKNGPLPARSVAVTFDDGYADNLYQAKPILEKFEVPATVFICTGYAGREIWWDELQRLVMSSAADPQELNLQAAGLPFSLNPSARNTEADTVTNVSERKNLRQALYQFLLTMESDEQLEAMKTIRTWAGQSSDISLNRMMNHAELLELAKDGLVELGSHTRNHPMLPRLSIRRQREEILQGKQDLESALDKPISGFAYPNGRATQHAKQIVQDAGFSYACTSLHDMVRPGCDPFELTRFWQQDVDGERFRRGVNLWLSLS